MRGITVVEEYPHPQARVWHMLTDAAALSEWLMPNDFVPEVGRHFTFTTKRRGRFSGVIHCQVLELEPPRRMSWSWQLGAETTRVTFELTPVDTGTRLMLRHDGFRGTSSIVPWFLFRRGWNRKLGGRLARALGLARV